MMPKLRPDIAWVLRKTRPFIPEFLGGFVLTIAATIAALTDPFIIKWLVDTALPARRLDLAIMAAVLFMGAQAFRMVTSAASGVLTFRATQKTALRLRMNLLRHLTNLSLDFHSRVAPGDKIFRVERDIDQLVDGGSGLVAQSLSFLSTTTLTLATMMYLNPRLTCAVLPLNALFLLLRRRFKSRLEMTSETVQQRASEASSCVQEHLNNVPQCQILRSERFQMLRITKALIAKARAETNRRIQEISFSYASLGIVSLGTTLVLAFGSIQVLRGTLSLGGLMASYALFARLFDPLGVATGLLSQFARVGTSIRRIHEIMNTRPSIQDIQSAVSIRTPVRGNLVFENVSYDYGVAGFELRNISLRIEKGETVGIVGPSGSGKTSLARLVPRLLEPIAGRILLDGHDIREVTLRSLRSHIAYVHQEAVLFNSTIKENLLFGDRTADDGALWRVIQAVQLEDRVRSLPSGLNTSVGPHGIRFSGGERQRLILARALLSRSSVLILDEATSALDEHTEGKILNAIAAETPARTIIVISHRSSSLKHVDRIVHLEQGALIDRDPSSEKFDAHRENTSFLCLPRNGI